MSQNSQQEHVSQKKVVYSIHGMTDVRVLHDLPYVESEAGAQTMDVYYPPGSQGSGARTPAVVFVTGYSDAGAQMILGCKFKEMQSYISWGRLTAASGLVAIIYTNREPASDLQALLEHLRRNAARLCIDENRIGVWACSGNVPLTLSALMRESNDFLKCAALCYGLMLDLGGATHVAEAARRWGFVNPCSGKSVIDLPPGLPLFIVRAGRDETPHLNETIDSFMCEALAHNLPVTLVNHPAAPHAFDLFDESETSGEIIRQILSFMRFHLLPIPG
ncbi:MAG TPA: alpha/beta hydrolase [Pyrinomonadaceae bacterium]|nr:alpha/beta hydrolase [Pyrinomonadaceae bacterium]